MNYPTQDRIKELFTYNPVTGLLQIKFKDGRLRNTSAKTNKGGYLRVSVDNRMYYAHRIIWILFHGYEPNIMDHINGIKTDNSIINLRNVTQSINMMNRKRIKSNTSGVAGVSFHNGTRTWHAEICVDGKRAYLGRHKTIFEAACARISAQNKLGFTERHGS